jgi:[ribosomal protein S18]-alanine N-acetyltransferase
VGYVIEPMRLEDIPEVSEIEQTSFSTSWSSYAYRRELTENRLARYLVARWQDGEESAVEKDSPETTSATSTQSQTTSPGFRHRISQFLRLWSRSEPSGSVPRRPSLVGYAGLWLMVDEAHITTIAVRPGLRHRGLGEMLMINLAEASATAGAARMTLEVRVSNREAQKLYEKFTFKEEGVRRRYYSDNNEDALIMWSEPLESAAFQERLAAIRDELQKRLAGNPPPPP